MEAYAYLIAVLIFGAFAGFPAMAVAIKRWRQRRADDRALAGMKARLAAKRATIEREKA